MKIIYSIKINLLLFILSSFLFSGCIAKENQPDKWTVTASFYPIYSIAKEIGKGSASFNILCLTQPQTGCLHDYQLTTSDLRLLDTADIFLINGLGMESFLPKIEELYPALSIVDTSEKVIPIKIEEEHEAKDHHHEDENSHVWLSPKNAALQAEAIKDAFVSLDKDNSALYEANFASFKKSMEQLEKELDNLSFSGAPAGIFHEGFPYLTSASNITDRFSIVLDEYQEPSAKELGNDIDIVKKEAIQILLAAPDSGLKFAQTIAAETNAKIYIIDPLTSPLDKEDISFTERMKQNVETLQTAYTISFSKE